MVARRIIPCLDVKEGQVVKGTQFREHRIIGDALTLAHFYNENNADELVFYDITASCEDRCVSYHWIEAIARNIHIPFCVAGGIRTLKQAESILNAGADKISINSPALENPNFIDELARIFGSQCVVIGVDSLKTNIGYRVCQYTGNHHKTLQTTRDTLSWIHEVQQRGAGEIVLNCMNQDGLRKGYDIAQLKLVRQITRVPLIASGGAGCIADFTAVFNEAHVDGALAASVFHNKTVDITLLKQSLADQHIKVRL